MPNIKTQRCFYNILIIYVIVQVFLITIYVKNRYAKSKINLEKSKIIELNILETYKNLSMRLNQDAEVDNSGVFKILMMKSIKPEIADDITIVSQCSSNHFSSVENLFKAWDGPISVAIYTEVKSIWESLWDMAKFIDCHNGRNFQMQLVVPFQDLYLKDIQSAIEVFSDKEYVVNCDSLYKSVQIGTVNYNWSDVYPVNLLRNVAKKQASTDYIMVIDIDMIPNARLRNDFLNFTKTHSPTSEKAVYVLPTFEIPLNVTPPVTNFELINLILHGKARPFYIEPCKACQRLIDFENWLSINTFFGIKLLKKVQWVHPWEPFFIARKEIPNFDERFKQYGMNRVSQICELHVAGYDFMVLDNAFLIHKGYKTTDGFHKTKEKEMNENRRIYNQFKTEIKYKYPDSDRSC